MHIHLSARTRFWINLIGVGVWGSGTAWLMAHYLFRAADAFELGTSPAEPLWLRIHAALGFLSIWTFGLLWSLHIVKAWNRHWHRLSGGTLFAALAALIVSGYLLYYIGDDRWRQVLSKLHWILGLLLPAAYVTHRLAKRFFPTGSSQFPPHTRR
jgi:hypothetical protein